MSELNRPSQFNLDSYRFHVNHNLHVPSNSHSRKEILKNLNH
jgi:hypothetical protein